MTIHGGDPFDTGEREPSRQLRARLGGRVTLWTSGTTPSTGPGGARGAAGLTVTSMMVAGGDTWRVLALLDPAADLTETLLATEQAVVSLLSGADRYLAEAFGGTVPAPGGPFRLTAWEETPWGPRLATARTWAGVRLLDASSVGWSTLVTCAVEKAVAGTDDEPLHHRLGRYV